MGLLKFEAYYHLFISSVVLLNIH